MRRFYAFEAEELSPEVKTQLEKVEDVVEDKCDTPEACDKMIDKIDGEQAKFNEALQTMSNAAKDCKDGKCDKAEMAATVAPKMAELKEVAKSIGVASEGDTLTEGELKDAKAYLEGAKEIVEAKKDELENGTAAPEKKEEGECEDCDEEPDEATECACEAYLDDLDIATESMMVDLAMEGTNIDALKARKAHLADIRAAKKEMKAAAKAKDYRTAAAKAREAASAAEALAADIDSLPQSAGSAAIVGIALAVVTIAASVGVGMGVSHTPLASAAAKAGKAVGEKVAAGARDKATGFAKGNIGAELKTALKYEAAASKVPGAVAGGAVAAASAGAIGKVLKRKGVSDTGDAKKLQPNDLNALLSAIKVDAKKLAQKFNKKAEEYEKMGSDSGSMDSFLGFCQACESLMIDGAGSSRSDAPYLF